MHKILGSPWSFMHKSLNCHRFGDVKTESLASIIVFGHFSIIPRTHFSLSPLSLRGLDVTWKSKESKALLTT